MTDTSQATDSNTPSVIFAGRWLRMCKRGRWEYVERTNPGGAAVILAVTQAGNVLFVEQFRVPIQCQTLEFPAGLIGDNPHSAGEHAAVTAARELEEETGYLPENVQFIHSGPSSAGMSTEMMAFYRASRLKRTGPGGGVPGENITVHEVPLAQAAQFVAAKIAQGFAVDPKVYTGLYFLQFGPDGAPLPPQWWL
jgi:ADP-ribose pyrophosphatase